MHDFKQLTSAIEQAHNQLQAKAASAVNQALTLRNWLIGYYIVEFEQRGKDRAAYGDGLIDSLNSKLNHIKGIDRRSLFRFRLFYLTYPQLGFSVADQFFLQDSTLFPSQKVGTVTPQFIDKLQVPAEKIFSRLSYSHIELLLNIDDPLKRTFYELECIKGTWSVRELKRQINSLYYERSGLSAQPEKLAERVRQQSKLSVPTDIIKNIYAFEFLDLKTRELVEESDLETALIDHIQEFIIELGNGFCFEARQRRILIGSTYYFIDLVFYHRILKCHVLIELKMGAFEHGDIGQLNTYLNYFKQEISEKNDNPPVGILLVAEKDHALVKYATAGMDENLFVKQYLIQLPSAEQLQQYMEKELRELR
ncbi:PDDEXK nuclease domain-containing protein [Rhabdobacter roseus]|uniref:Putative nuclease of restriction endonuclease-like (RecB) superfamily n=1 Tax=Rhabdobacter roseus TaxID=1655419 RepID=A0A840TT93_9BACT|nr:PDDEXK nuclease domain-containing protein [Rhabdobacter roseus]MBB5286115.1 putative nuclease of restriction endonuclease-like (RecB) superfamily [Rhabdobacter roseus]